MWEKELAKRPGKILNVSLGNFVFFLIWPFGALIRVLRNIKDTQSKGLFLLFCIYFGFVFIYEDPALKKFGADSASYADDLIFMHNKPVSFGDLKARFYNKDEGVVDIFQPTVTWLVSLISGDPRLLFTVFAAVFGFFFTQNLWIVFNRINIKIGLVILLFMLFYALINPIWNINGVRMWTAAQIFSYGLLRYFLNNDKKGLIWSGLSVFVHFSFLFPLALFFVWLFIPKRSALFFYFYIVTAFIDEVNLLEVRSALSFLPEIFQPRVEGYTNEAYANIIGAAKGQLALHVKLASIISHWMVYVWVTVLFIRSGKWGSALPNIYKFFLFALFYAGFAHLAANVPSGGRFLIVSDFLFYSIFLLVIGQSQTHFDFRNLQLITIPFLSYLIIFQMRGGLDYIGVMTFFGNPFLAMIFESQTPIMVFIKQLI